MRTFQTLKHPESGGGGLQRSVCGEKRGVPNHHANMVSENAFPQICVVSETIVQPYTKSNKVTEVQCILVTYYSWQEMIQEVRRLIASQWATR
jgi:hypothetical protein